MKPVRNEVIKKSGLAEYEKRLDSYISSNDQDITAKIDKLKLVLKKGEYEKFRIFYHSLRKTSSSPVLKRELAKYLLFVEKDFSRAQKVLNGISCKDESQPAWVHYFSGNRRNYYEKLYDDIFYTAIPKNASTSLKTYILKSVLRKDGLNPHSVFGNPFFKSNVYQASELKDSKKFLVLRKPEDRFLSYYFKNILSEDSLSYEYGLSSKNNEEIFGLKLRPTLDELLSNLSRYCLVFNDVFHHTLPQAAYIGDINSYNYICDVSEVDTLVSYVAEIIGLSKANNKAPREMVGEKREDRNSLLPSMSILKKIYSDDYHLLSLSHDNLKVSRGVKEYVPSSSLFSFIS